MDVKCLKNKGWFSKECVAQATYFQVIIIKYHLKMTFFNQYFQKAFSDQIFSTFGSSLNSFLSSSLNNFSFFESVYLTPYILFLIFVFIFALICFMFCLILRK